MKKSILILLSMLTSQAILANNLANYTGTFKLTNDDNLQRRCSDIVKISLSKDENCLVIVEEVGIDEEDRYVSSPRRMCNLDARAQFNIVNNELVSSEKFSSVKEGVMHSFSEVMDKGFYSQVDETLTVDQDSLIQSRRAFFFQEEGAQYHLDSFYQDLLNDDTSSKCEFERI